MANVYIVQTISTGYTGAPGYTNFAYLPLTTQAAVDSAVAAARTFWNTIAQNFLPAVQLAVQQQVKFYDETTGNLAGAVSATTAPLVVSGLSVANIYAAGAGASIKWLTNTVKGGTLPRSKAHVVSGRTFIVPYGGMWTNDGTPTNGDITNLQGGANALRATSGITLAVWHRDWDKSTDPWTQVGGEAIPVTGVFVADKASSLRSRRT